MLRRILAISGRPGLFRLVSQGKNMLIVEDLTSGKRFPAHQRDRVSSLGDISMFTLDGDVPLAKVLTSLYAKQEGKSVDLAAFKAEGDLRAFFAEVLPDYDEMRVHISDIRKLISWYNLLVASGMTEFEEKEENAAEEKAAE
ncbi:MAG: DUF5606 domain-containing protein [Muribaculaceae bacterium]|nr:DUF5606 domain-containing protein [Muribaculaceae bacterium]